MALGGFPQLGYYLGFHGLLRLCSVTRVTWRRDCHFWEWQAQNEFPRLLSSIVINPRWILSHSLLCKTLKNDVS
jgi:hypothetical protein